jgi:hypothetical protein
MRGEKKTTINGVVHWLGELNTNGRENPNTGSFINGNLTTLQNGNAH